MMTMMTMTMTMTMIVIVMTMMMTMNNGTMATMAVQQDQMGLASNERSRVITQHKL